MRKKEILASAPGKLHLIGEHAVVYGEPAILVSVGLRTYVKVRESEKVSYFDATWPEVKYEWSINEIKEITEKTLSLWKICKEKNDFSELFDFIKKDEFKNYKASAIGIIMKELNTFENCSIEIECEIPTGAGIGSSASRAVAITLALSKFLGNDLDLEEVNRISYEIEKIVHGTPSGGDNSACCFGGLILFRKLANSIEIKSLKEEIPYKLENFVIVYTKPPEKTTGELVQHVRNLPEEYREKRIRRIGELTYEMLEVLKRRDFERMKEIINEDQKLLKELGVSCKEIDELCEKVREIGGAAKLCGAGGGGIVLCYHEDNKRLVKAIKDFGYKPIEVELCVDGARFENNFKK
ncbi:MAG: mevalonate kinase [Candidatus Aenigmatarchaeota archaeon]